MSESTCVGHPWLKRSRPADYSKYSPSFPEIPIRVCRFPVSAGPDDNAAQPHETAARRTPPTALRSRRHQREALSEVDREPGPRHVPESGGARHFRSTPRSARESVQQHDLGIRRRSRCDSMPEAGQLRDERLRQLVPPPGGESIVSNNTQMAFGRSVAGTLVGGFIALGSVWR